MISVVLRVLNEAKFLDSLLSGISRQDTDGMTVETVVVDSGSSDGSLEIAKSHGCRILHIRKEDFSFGRSLNIGCDAALGDFLVMVSGHCIPHDRLWLRNLVAPLKRNEGSYSYGRQIGNQTSKFSELQIFAKYFPQDPALAQKGFFCNNANAAVLKDAWTEHEFNEELTGLEDMELAKRLVTLGHEIVYAPDAVVYHLHEESWPQVKRRFEREAIALQQIMPEVHVHFADFLRYLASAVIHDFNDALKQRVLMRKAYEVFMFRFMQYLGTYRGNQLHREMSREMKERYFYPKIHGTPHKGLPEVEGMTDAQASKDSGFAATKSS